MTQPDGKQSERTGPSPVAAVVAMLGLVAAVTVGALALGSSTPAGATGLERFASCAELEAWTSDVQQIAVAEGFGRDEDPATTGAPVPEAAGAASDGSADTAARDTGGTNTVVEGVDEIDVIDRVSDDRLLVSRNGVLALVDLAGRQVVDQLGPIPYDGRISAADGVVFIAGSAADGSGVEVRRVRIDGDALVDDGTWTSPGWLLDARRTGDRLHVVAVDQPYDAIPFAGGPVPCEDVWRPVAPATTAAATLVASLPASGALAPIAVAEVTGSAGNLLVTDRSVYLATESWSADGTVTTGLHRFEIGSLTPTGSGSVPGSVAGPFALDEHEGTLRVATNAGGGVMVGRPIPVEGDVIIEDAAAADRSAVAEVAAAPAQDEPPAETTTTTEPETTTTEPESTTTTTEPDTTTTTVAETTTTVPETTTTTVVDDPAALAEVFVLDTEGDLDLLGRSGRFGHDYETIHGMRFSGDVAYVVTFLQTDPFWVVDLADPAAPRVVGELRIPGFSGYLHPVGDGRVVGFGPDGSGSVAARLFDVTDPAAPSLLDEVRLGDESPVAFDHHAFAGLGGGAFAVPVNDWPDELVERDCVIDPDQPVPLPEPAPVPTTPPGTGAGTPGSSGDAGIAEGEPVPPVCTMVQLGGGPGVAVLEVANGRLSLVDREVVEDRSDVYAERVVRAPDGTWLVLGYDRLLATDGTELLLPTA